MYSHPKIYKQDVLYCPILSVIGSSQHELAKFLTALLQPVLELYSTNCINDSFSFAEMIQLEVNSNDSILCSFDICSLFTNVPLMETIEICIETLYDSHLSTPVLMKTATTLVKFSFNNIMYQKMDQVAMGNPLGLTLANIFFGYNKSKLFNKISKLLIKFKIQGVPEITHHTKKIKNILALSVLDLIKFTIFINSSKTLLKSVAFLLKPADDCV